MKKLIATALLSIPLLALAGPVNLLGNGNFEGDAVGTSSWTVSYSPKSWTTANNGMELRNNVAGTAFDGSNFVELDGYANSGISQTIDTVAGQWYALSFEYSNRAGTDPSTNGLAWSFGSASGDAPALAMNTGSDNLWQLYSTTVQATATQTTLTIWATGTSDSYGSSLDAVSLSAVPEPQSLALVAAALFALALAARRRMPARRSQPR